MAYLYRSMGKKDKCLNQLDHILQYESQTKTDDYIKDFIKKTKELKKSIQE